MKFGDKLIQLRKKQGLSQEELAAKLNVSRQSVSKWESNNTYPETDKIVQICNIFDCTMDDLINENINDITMIERNSKKQLNMAMESFLGFITDTINMFCHMKFSSCLKCIFELGIICLILFVFDVIILNTLVSVLHNIFAFVPRNVLYTLNDIFYGIIILALGILSVIILVHIFKIRYLNYYKKAVLEESFDKDLTSKETNNCNASNFKEKLEKEDIPKVKYVNKEPHIVIRDKEPFAFLNVLTKMFLAFVKFMAAIFVIPFALMLLLLVAFLVISIGLSKYSQMFIGFDIGIGGLIVGTILLLCLTMNFIIGRKANVKVMIILFFISVITTGIGIGVSIISMKEFTFADDLVNIMNFEDTVVSISYTDNLAILNSHDDETEYRIDDGLVDNEIKVVMKLDPRFHSIKYYKDYYYGIDIDSFYLGSNANIKEVFNIIVDDLKNKTLRNYDTYVYNSSFVVIANSKTINKLLDNLSKVFTYDQTNMENGYRIMNVEDRVIINGEYCVKSYNALTDEISYDSDCTCKKIASDNYIKYECDYDD